MHYQLFLPEWPTNPDPQKIESESRKRGISDVWDNSDKLTSHDGPGGKSGLLVAWLNPKNTQHVYNASQQTWFPSIQKLESGEHAYWIGVWNDKWPTESELRRSRFRQGSIVPLGGQKWVVPTYDTVEKRAVYNDDWTMRWDIIPEFTWLKSEAELIASSIKETPVRTLELEIEDEPSKQIAWLLKLLRVNYRMLPELAMHMSLWTPQKHIFEQYLLSLGLRIVTKAVPDGN